MAKKGLFERFKTIFIRQQIIPSDADDLNAAILTGNRVEVQNILNKGLNPDQPDELNRFPLHFATIKNKPEIISLLISKGADIHLLDNNGNTALMIGAKEGSVEACRMLIHLGIDYFLQNNKEQSALDIAIDSGNLKMIELFQLRLKELELIIRAKRKEQAAKYSSLADRELGIEGAMAGGRVQKPVKESDNFVHGKLTEKSLPQLELEFARLDKKLNETKSD